MRVFGAGPVQGETIAAADDIGAGHPIQPPDALKAGAFVAYCAAAAAKNYLGPLLVARSFAVGLDFQRSRSPGKFRILLSPN